MDTKYQLHMLHWFVSRGVKRFEAYVVCCICRMQNSKCVNRQTVIFFSRHSCSQSKRHCDFVIAMHYAIVWRIVSKLTTVFLMETLVLNVLTDALNYVSKDKVMSRYQVNAWATVVCIYANTDQDYYDNDWIPI